MRICAGGGLVEPGYQAQQRALAAAAGAENGDELARGNEQIDVAQDLLSAVPSPEVPANAVNGHRFCHGVLSELAH